VEERFGERPVLLFGRHIMSNGNSYEDVISRLAEESDVVGRLAQDAGGFAAVVASFEAKDANAFSWALERLEMLPHCELICEWVRIKLGVLRCREVCGPPREAVETPDLQQFARAIVRLADNERLLRRVVDAVSCGNGDDYRAAIAELELSDFCYLLCHWVYSIVYRRVCEVVCSAQPVPLPDPVTDIRAAARVIARVAANQDALDAIAKAALTLDSATLQSAINEAGLTSICEIICRVICSWRCVWVCRELCELPTPVLTGAYGIEEARNFALAARQLASQPRALGDLVTAVQNRDAQSYSEIITRFGLGPYCRQVCAWVCSETCYLFCTRVCPNPVLNPLFTTVGAFYILSDIDATSGKTNKSHTAPGLYFGGGPDFAFRGQLQLGGFCPSTSPAFPGVAMRYRFLYDDGSGPAPVASTLVYETEGPGLARSIQWPALNTGTGLAEASLVATAQSIIIRAATPLPDPTPPAPGTTWFAPGPHYIQPDADGWVQVDANAIGGGFSILLDFDTTQVPGLAGGPPLAGAIGTPGGVPAGNAVPLANQRAGSDLSITFEATRVGVSTVDYSNSLAKIHINNWTEVNNLWFHEFEGVGGCCTPIDNTLSVQFTTDHEAMASGGWSLGISSCSPSAPGNITPTASGPGVTVTPRGGWGTIVENTGGVSTTLVSAVSASQNSFTVTSSAGFPSAPFNAWLCNTGEAVTVTGVSGTTWTVLRGQEGTTPAPAAAGAEVTTAWCNCSYTVTLSTRAGLTTGLVDNLGETTQLTFCICGH
jgi:hypothetical protein